MLNDFSYEPNEKAIIEAERAMMEIRRGAAILLTGETGSVVTAAAETISLHQWQQLNQLGSPVYLALTAMRANYLFGSVSFEQPVMIEVSSLTLDSIQMMAESDKIDTVLDIYSFAIEPVNHGAIAAIHLAKAAELLPSMLIISVEQPLAELHSWAERNRMMTVDIITANAYQQFISSPLTMVASSSIHLADAENARICAFRPVTGGKEHYAIIIGTPELDEAPLVRIHSSCYTGDLLGSLRCDCGDQLRSAIKFMGKNLHGGIIIYLLQEGRGIGLVNKLRAYSLQEREVDTVDANRILGFEDDERQFLPAAEILKNLSYKTIRLLTNNYRKKNGLQEYGIAVTECVPHVMPAHSHNEKYLKTKANRLGHNLPK